MRRAAALVPALLLAFFGGAAAAEDCGPLVATYLDRSVPFAATFVTSGGFQNRPPMASRHVWTGKDWYFWLRGTGWFSAHEGYIERTRPMPPVMVCENRGEVMLHGEAAIFHTLHIETPDGTADDMVWTAKASGLLLKSVHRTAGNREFTVERDYRNVPAMPE